MELQYLTRYAEENKLSNNNIKRIAIVGAGISGLTLANILKNNGFFVNVFESFSEVKAVGAGMTLWPNATRILKNINALDPILGGAQILSRLNVLRKNGQQIMSIPIEEFDSPAIAVHRADLHAALLKNLSPNDIYLNHHCEGIVEDNDSISIKFKNKSVKEFDLIVGADGIHSEIKKFVLNKNKLNYKGYIIWRGIAQGLENILPSGVFTETWGEGHRFGILPMGRKQICWYASTNWNRKVKHPPIIKTEIEKIFSHWHNPIPKILNYTDEKTIIRNEALDSKPYAGWSKSNVVLMGDSIHPTAPNLGQGGCMAIEDAFILGYLLNLKLPLLQTLLFYEKMRRARVTRVVRRSSILGDIGQWQNPIMTVIRNSIASLIPGTIITHSSRPLHGYLMHEIISKHLNSLSST